MSDERYLDQMKAMLDRNKKLQTLINSEEVKKGLKLYEVHCVQVYNSAFYKDTKLFIQVLPAPYKHALEHLGEIASPQFHLQIINKQEQLLKTLCKFEIETYPYCCGMKQLNGFSYSEIVGLADIAEELIHTFISACVQTLRAMDWMTSRRLILNMVENGRRSREDPVTYDPQPIENPSIQFPRFFTWAKKQPRFRESLMYNANSNNIIHHIEVIVP